MCERGLCASEHRMVTSRLHMPMYSVSLRVLPTSTSRLEGEIIFILVTFLSMISAGRSNSSTMHSGMAPPHGCTGTSFCQISLCQRLQAKDVQAVLSTSGNCEL